MGTRRSSENAVTDLPEPEFADDADGLASSDSNEMLSTAPITPRSVRKRVVRSSNLEERVRRSCPISFKRGIERVVEAVGHERDAECQQADAPARERSRVHHACRRYCCAELSIDPSSSTFGSPTPRKPSAASSRIALAT